MRDQKYDGINFTSGALSKGGEYEGCVFTACNFSGLDLSGTIFIDCRFEQCDLSMAKLVNTSFQEVHFKGCKQLGLRFDECSKMILSFSFEACTLNLSVFFQLKLKGTQFRDCQLREVDFGACDLTNANFSGCDLNSAMFENTILEGADFRTANNFSINPEINKMRKARFSTHGLAGLLGKYQIVVSDF
jgi:fluoroquinolone resistance protein